jgi:dihydroorotase
MSAIRLVNGRVIDPASGRDEIIDVIVEHGRITQWGREAHAVEAETRDVNGCWITPAFVDTCARLREPGQKQHGTIASETAAARMGGFLHLAVPPDTQPFIDSGATAYQIIDKARQAGSAQAYPIGAITRGLQGQTLSNMASLKQAGCIGVGNARAPFGSTQTLLHCLEYAATLGLTVFFSPEEASLAAGCAHDGFMAARLGLPGIPDTAETVALATQLLLVEQTGVRAHFGQLSCKSAVELIRIAKDRGLPVTADVAMHHLHLTDNAIDGFNSMAHVRPPLRSEKDREALRAGVQSGIIDAICSDHQPLNAAAKLAPFPGTEPGMSTLETLLPLGLKLVRANVLTEAALISALTINPATILGLGAGQVSTAGSGIIVIDPQRRWTVDAETLLSLGKNTPFLGREMEGSVVAAYA